MAQIDYQYQTMSIAAIYILISSKYIIILIFIAPLSRLY